MFISHRDYQFSGFLSHNEIITHVIDTQTFIRENKTRDQRKNEKENGKMVNVSCLKCNREGSLLIKQTKSKGKTYRYYYIEHHIGNKIKWCYLGKYEVLPDEYKKLIHKDTQTDTQNNIRSENPSSSLFLRKQLLLKSRGWELNPHIAALQAAA